MLEAEFAQEHMAQTTEDQMALDRTEFTYLKMVHAQLCLAVFKGPLDRPSGKGHPQQRLGRGSRRGIANKVFDLVVIEGVPSHQQMIRSRGQTLLIGQINRDMLGLPDHRSLAAILDVIILPLARSHNGRMTQDISHLHPGVVLDLQTRIAFLRPPFLVAVVLAVKHPRPSGPGHEVYRYFSHIVLPSIVQFSQKMPVSAVMLVESQPGETQTIADRPLILLQSDLPLGTIHDILRNAGLLTPLTIFVPGLFGQIRFSVQQRVEIRRGITQMYADHAVFDLAHGATVLTLDAGGFVAFLGKAGLINNSNAVRMAMPPGDVLLQTVSGSSLIPAEQAQELLEVPGRFTESVSHRLDALSGQVAQLTFNVEVEIAACRDSAEAVVKLVQESRQFRFDSHNRLGVHVDNLLKNDRLQEYHRPAA